MSLEDILAVSEMIRNATSLITGSQEGTLENEARDLHAGGKKRSCPHGFS
ncbi:hypothetical protein IMZ48_29465 [Candidatus Bathyarchaeota archaeon]|nr:hypothetical protein [Candidatus Bathyarchaeota archaeon]